MIKKGLIALIRIYQKLISPLIGRRCRFYPSCSEYAAGALKHNGLIKGLYLTIKRLIKCNPWHPGGIDFPPGESIGDSESHSDGESMP